jgi:DNA helicase-2/ATP-dependent DNA helicase PcrA
MVISSLKRLAAYTREQFNRFIASLKYPPNKFQYAVLEKIAFGDGNITVDSKAGSGKTSLLKMIASLLLDMGIDPSEVIFQAFNKSIEEELNHTLPKGFTAKTSHSLGLAMCREYAQARGIKLGKLSDKKYTELAKYIAEKIHPSQEEEDKRFKAITTLSKLIGYIMANNTDPKNALEVADLAYHYALDVTSAMITWMPYAIEQAIERFEKYGEMDFIDMIYMPVKLKMEPKHKYYYVLIDEAQDLNSLQQEISEKLLHPQGRAIIVGDPQQSLYAFSGADSQAFYNMNTRFNTTVLELNTCYRCPTSHIQVAQSLVPSIEAAPNAIEGTIEFKHLDLLPSMSFGSMVICRLNAPLMAAYFQFIAAEKPAVIIGRDMGKGLVALVDKIAEMEGFRYYNVSHFIDRYFDMEEAKLEKKPNGASKISQLLDQITCLKVCVDNFDCQDLDCFKAKMEALFVDFKDKNLDKSKVVTLCTVHRAKGLEADHIGIIYQRPNSAGDFNDIMPLVWEKQRAWELEQEFNIKYVAFTRAKQTMTIFGGYKADQVVDLTAGNEFTLSSEEEFEDEEEFDIEGGDTVYNYPGEAFEEDEEDEMEESEPMTAFALAEQEGNSHTLLESLEEAIEEAAPIVVVETESLQPSDPRLEKAHTLLKRTIRALRSAIETDDARNKKDYLWDAERYGKDFQVAQSQMNDFLFEEREILLGNENNRVFTWNNLRDRTYYLIGDDSNLGEVYAHAVKVLQSFSKPETAAAEAIEEQATTLPPRKPTVSELVHLNPDLPIDNGVFHRAVSIAQKLREARLWDGETKIRFENAYDTHTAITGFQELPLTSLVLKRENDEWLVSLPKNSPADEKPAEEPAAAASPEVIPTEPVEWAKWMFTNKQRVVIWDVETTDKQTNPSNFEIVQGGLINLDGEVLFNRYIRPFVSRITAGAFDVHGINNAVLDKHGALSLISEYESLKAAIEGKIVIAYNSPFDKAALENSLKLCGLDPIEIHSWHCAMRMYTKHNPNKVDGRGRRSTNWKLTEAVAQQGLPVDENAHDALADVRMTLALIQSMAQDAPDRWQAVKALPAPKVEAPLIKEGDTVRVKASGVLMTVTRVEGQELNLVDETGWRGKMRIGMVEPAKKPEVFAEPVHEEAAPLVETVLQAESLEAPAPVQLMPEAVVIVSQPKKALPIEALEAIIKSLGSREVAIEAKELLSSIIDEVFPA